MILKAGYIFFILVQVVVAIYLLLPTILFLLHYIVSIFRQDVKSKYPRIAEREFDFAAIVTAHKDIRFIEPLVDSFLRQKYSNFIVYIVADDCDISTLHYNDNRIVILKPETPFHAKIKSIKHAVSEFVRNHEVVIVFDSDNLVHPDYLYNLNDYFCRGFKAVQTHMLSKNTDTVYSKLDSIGHIYNTFIERQARMELGLSSTILGLGIAIDIDLYNKVMYKDSLGGFDKKLQAQIVTAISQLGFASDAIVFDEKVDDGTTLERQRIRWIYTYFKYFKDNLRILKSGFRNLSFNQLYFGFNTLRPPLFITMGLAFIFLLVNLYVAPYWSLVWGFVVVLFAVTFILIVLTQSKQRGMGKALFFIPAMVFRQIRSLFKLNRAKSSFLKTEHSKVIFIADLLKNENS